MKINEIINEIKNLEEKLNKCYKKLERVRDICAYTRENDLEDLKRARDCIYKELENEDLYNL
jgi:uncharacterized coiled-coil DUF342 family protein